MYGMVTSDHSKSSSRQQQSGGQQQSQQPPQLSHGGGHHRTTSRTANSSSSSNKSLYIRLVEFIQHAWTGVKFALDSELLEETERPPRYRPHSIQTLSRLTKFSEGEIKRIYRGFKAECPSGIVQEDTFCDIYAQFFPQGANTANYAHFFFNTLDTGRQGIISFQDFVLGLSVLSRGTLLEKLRWTFNLYDVNGDGYISREEMTEVVTAIYDLMGNNCAQPFVDDVQPIVQDRVDMIFQKMDRNLDDMISMEEFVTFGQNDQNITESMAIFDSVI